MAGFGERVGVLGRKVGFVEDRFSSRGVSNFAVVVLLLEFGRRFFVRLGFGLLGCQPFNHRDEFVLGASLVKVKPFSVNPIGRIHVVEVVFHGDHERTCFS